MESNRRGASPLNVRGSAGECFVGSTVPVGGGRSLEALHCQRTGIDMTTPGQTICEACGKRPATHHICYAGAGKSQRLWRVL